MFMIQMKKALHKPFEVPFFMSPDYEVASWFFYNAPFPVEPVSKTLFKVDHWFNLEKVEPDTRFEHRDVSPDFRVKPAYVYGRKSTFELPDGTAHYDWFEPCYVTFSPLSRDRLREEYSWDEMVVVQLNMWHFDHIFKKRFSLVKDV